MRRRTLRILAAIAVAAALVSGCADSGGDSKPQVCTSLEAVQHSVERIQNVNYSENGMSALQSDLEQLRTNLVALVTDVAAQFQAEIIEVRTAADQLAATVRTAAEDPSRANLDNARTALSELDGAVDQLATAMGGTCSGAA